ncbi:MAG: helix-turn-helix transcriptional regulator [Candidatus Dojkabacteria bacterium]
MLFGKRLYDERKKNNLSTEALAKKCGVSRSYITLIENNKRLPGKKQIPKIAVALKLRTNIIINWYLEDIREKLENASEKAV